MDTHGTLRLDPAKVRAYIVFKKNTKVLIFTKENKFIIIPFFLDVY